MADYDETISPAEQANFLASGRTKLVQRIARPDESLKGPLVRCPRCRAEQSWSDLDQHIVKTEGDSEFRHCSNVDCASIFSKQEGLDARTLHGSGVTLAESVGDGGTFTMPGYKPPSVERIDFDAGDVLVADEAKKLALNLLRFANGCTGALGVVKAPDLVSPLLETIEKVIGLAHSADTLGDKSAFRVPDVRVEEPTTTDEDAGVAERCPLTIPQEAGGTLRCALSVHTTDYPCSLDGPFA